MRFTTVFFFVAVWAAIAGSQIMDGSSPAKMFTHPGPLVLVWAGSMAAAFMAMGAKDLKPILAGWKLAFLGRPLPAAEETIGRIKELAEVSRREGLMALEGKINTLDGDPFLKRGGQLILDGLDPAELRSLLESEINCLEDRHKVGQKWFEDAGGYAPTIGIIGTVGHLIYIMENLANPETLGPAIGAGFLATLWGLIAANVVYLPLSAKLKRLTAEEVAHRELVVEGLMAVHTGKLPSAVVESMRSQLSASQRQKISEN